MKTIYRQLLLLPFIFAAGQVKAQPDNINNWLQYTGSYRFNPQWNLNTALQYRTYNALTDLRVMFTGADAQYTLKSVPISLSTGYAHLLNRRYKSAEETSIDRENRLYQQIAHRTDIGRVNVTHRYQVEERWLQAGFHVRLRYSTALRIPIGGAQQEKRPWYVLVRNEIRVIVRDNPFDSNRVSGGFGYVFNRNLALEGTWMSQLGANDNHQHFTMFVLKHDFGRM